MHNERLTQFYPEEETRQRRMGPLDLPRTSCALDPRIKHMDWSEKLDLKTFTAIDDSNTICCILVRFLLSHLPSFHDFFVSAML